MKRVLFFILCMTVITILFGIAYFLKGINYLFGKIR